MQHLGNYGKSIIRTIVPILLGVLTAAIANPPKAGAGLGGFIAIAYAVVVRAVEQKYPKAGVLLGVKGAPSYPSQGSPSGAESPPAS